MKDLKYFFKNVIILTTTVCIGEITYGQYVGQVRSEAVGGQSGGIVNQYLIGSNWNKQKQNLIGGMEVNGSPYVSPDFRTGILYYGDKAIERIDFRYNAFNEELEIRDSDAKNGIGALQKDKKIAIEIGNDILSFKTFTDKSGTTINGYLLQKYDGNTYDLFERTTVKFTEPQKAQNSFTKDIPARFTKFTEYYLGYFGDGNLIVEIPNRTRKFLKMFDGDQSKEIKKFIKSNDINIKEEEQLLIILKFLNDTYDQQ
ncbi:hypothetical protein J4E06_06440 [Muricauda sp. NFXS6]|uniref:hypothetical protein n=1 Tax=Allomuricauda sp. NFXS6 TaxID=2819094 RepID=UPI0032DE48DB